MLRILAKHLPKKTQCRTASSLSKNEQCTDDDIPESPALSQMKKNIRERRPSQRMYSFKLKQKLECSQEQIRSMDLSVFMQTPVPKVTDRLQFLTDAGASAETITQNIHVLNKPLDQLSVDVEAIKSLEPRCFNDLVPLLTLAGKDFEQTINRLRRDGVENNRIYYMSKVLEVEPAKMAKMYVAHHKFMNAVTIKRLKERFQILLLHKVSPEKLRRNLSILNRSARIMDRRLYRVTREYGGELQPWMVHCKNSRIERHVNAKVENLSFLKPNETVAEFMARKLCVDRKYIDALILKRPKILKMNLRKLSGQFEFLLDKCHYTGYQIISNPHIIFFDQAKIKRRVVECRDVYNIKPTSLTIFAKSETEYRKVIADILQRRQGSAQKDS